MEENSMTIQEAATILDLHQQWRKGAEIPMQDPTRLGVAIDIILPLARDFRRHIMTAYHVGVYDGGAIAHGGLREYKDAADYFTTKFTQ